MIVWVNQTSYECSAFFEFSTDTKFVLDSGVVRAHTRGFVEFAVSAQDAPKIPEYASISFVINKTQYVLSNAHVYEKQGLLYSPDIVIRAKVIEHKVYEAST